MAAILLERFRGDVRWRVRRGTRESRAGTAWFPFPCQCEHMMFGDFCDVICGVERTRPENPQPWDCLIPEPRNGFPGRYGGSIYPVVLLFYSMACSEKSKLIRTVVS